MLLLSLLLLFVAVVVVVAVVAAVVVVVVNAVAVAVAVAVLCSVPFWQTKTCNYSTHFTIAANIPREKTPTACTGNCYQEMRTI